MLILDAGGFNSLEMSIHLALTEAVKTEPNIKIKRAAEICGCSVSKISKFGNKLGFKSYKEYISYICGDKPKEKNASAELTRIRDFVDSFDSGIVDDFIRLLDKYDKIILFGYGPSLICARYFEYKLRIVTSKTVMTATDEATAKNLMDDRSLFIVFSTTGKFRSFSELFACAEEKRAGRLMIAEEYNTALLDICGNVIYLTKSTQGENVPPYEKSRIVFFIFIEVVLLRLLAARRENEAEGVQ